MRVHEKLFYVYEKTCYDYKWTVNVDQNIVFDKFETIMYLNFSKLSLYLAHKNMTDTDPVIIPYIVTNRLLTTLYQYDRVTIRLLFVCETDKIT